jgi:hypothetical protein
MTSGPGGLSLKVWAVWADRVLGLPAGMPKTGPSPRKKKERRKKKRR